MFCGFCGNQMPDGSRFCTRCGNPMQPAGQQPNDFTRMEPQGGQSYNQNVPPQGQSYNQNVPPQGQYYDPNVPPQGYDPGYNGQYQAPPQGQPYYAPSGAGAAVGRAAAGAVKHASHLGLILGIVGAVAAVLIIVLVVVPAVSGRSVEKTVAQLEESLSKMDMDGVMDCFDSSSQQMLSGARGMMDGIMGIADSMFDTNMGDLYGLAEGLGGILGAAGLGPEVTIDIVNKNQIDNETCVVSVYMTFSMPSFYGTYETSSESQSMDLYMVKEGNDWCISLTNTPEMQELFNNFSY